MQKILESVGLKYVFVRCEGNLSKPSFIDDELKLLTHICSEGYFATPAQIFIQIRRYQGLVLLTKEGYIFKAF